MQFNPSKMQSFLAAVLVSLALCLAASPVFSGAVSGRQDSGNQAASSSAQDKDESCHLRELDLCLASVAVFTQSTNTNSITNNEINKQCKLLVETEGCLSNYTRRCMTEQQAQLIELVADGGLDTIRELCKSQSKLRDSYLKHGDCINRQDRMQKVCMRDFQASLEKAADIGWQDRLKLACCSYNKLHACVRDAIEPKCGTEAYELSSTFFRASFSRMPQLACNKYEYSSKACAALLPPAGTQPKGPKSHSVLSKLLSAYTNS